MRTFRHVVIKFMSLFEIAQHCLLQCEPEEKVKATQSAARLWRSGEIALTRETTSESISEAGRPERPPLVAPKALHRRSLSTPEGHAALIHSIVHIEFNAINLAWDAVYRFREMPRQFYDDWVRVAEEEAHHFQLLRDHLNSLGYDYGDFDAHNGLWEMTVKTAHDPLVRMALVPRVLEARGLDVTPGIIKKLSGQGDHAAVAILDIILRDEVGHVEIGTHWFHYLCAERHLEPDATFRGLFEEYMGERGKRRSVGPLHREARLAAGFSESELAFLEGVS